jgi:hypothetical protein
MLRPGFINHELDPDRAPIDWQTIKMRLISPHDPEVWCSRYITQTQWSSISALIQKRDNVTARGPYQNGHRTSRRRPR